MLSENLADFTQKSKYLPDLAPDVAFLIKPDFFYGSFNKPEPNDMRDKVVKLYQPRQTRSGHLVLSAAALGHEAELVRYYISIVKAATQHRKQLKDQTHYFWMRPVLLSRGEVLLSFPWYDTFPESASLLKSLLDPIPEGLLYNDMEQGWTGAAYATADRVYFLEGDEGGRVHTACHTDRARLQQAATAALARTRQIMEVLVKQVGQDYWRFGNGK
ncbi:hypothetical protein [Hymenobacter negativus]|uniref:Uncharacterized protein n=1 Tax=Hymenobacter negativus TaxID=2795026 RepID=A0ABS3QED5_9BACT|nr:hypothetical protein [Hymenobacter negativus]MBO2009456.1 hypothetical protein [Hymenobacter negativus]